MNEQRHDLSTELAACRQELAEARAQQEAVAEVLRLISRAPTGPPARAPGDAQFGRLAVRCIAPIVAALGDGPLLSGYAW